MILTAPPDFFVSSSEVLRRTGWTRARLAELGPPDRLISNRRNYARPVKVWRLSHVIRVERTAGA